MPGIILHRRSDSTLRAFTGTKPRVYFTVTSDLSPELIELINKAPSFSWHDTLHWPPSNPGKPRVVKAKGPRFTAGIDLDYLPAGVARPKLKRLKEAKKSNSGITTSNVAAAAPVFAQQTQVMTSAAPAPAASLPAISGAAAARPKGLEIDMLPGAFMALGERSSRPKKRPARYD
ncbi:MAG: hypothetical protein LQ338_003290 [Usnochroma carphineum]|nr:MAG: hypothetical protein LQ338_003290 [Usnochroma carphineum]